MHRVRLQYPFFIFIFYLPIFLIDPGSWRPIWRVDPQNEGAVWGENIWFGFLGSLERSLPSWHKAARGKSVWLILYSLKSLLFLPWLQFCLSSSLNQDCGLLRKGSILLADNVICPGTPDYLEHVRNSPRYKSQYFKSHLEYTKAEDGLEKSVFLG